MVTMVRIFALIALLCLAGTGHAQQWPAKPVRVLVKVAPGDIADVTMRLLGARLTETLGQPFVVENRAGGDGYIGFEAALRSEPDGYTLVYAPGSSVMIAPHLVRRLCKSPERTLRHAAPRIGHREIVPPGGRDSSRKQINKIPFQLTTDFARIDGLIPQT